MKNYLKKFNVCIYDSMKEEIKNWWKQALTDLDTAKSNLKNNKYYACSFFCQQAVEKALKALYLKKFKKLIKIHNIVILAERLKLPKELIEKCNELNPVYIETRYPDAGGSLPAYRYTQDDAETDLASAKKVIAWLKKKI